LLFVSDDFQILQLGQGGQLVVQQMPQTQTFQIPGQGGQMQQVFYLFTVQICLQCIDAVGWAAGRASGL